MGAHSSRALGLRGIGQTNVLPDVPDVRGMLARVPHLIEVTEEPTIAASKAKPRRTKET